MSSELINKLQIALTFYRPVKPGVKALFDEYVQKNKPAVIFGDLTDWTGEEIQRGIDKLLSDFIAEYKLTEEDCFD